MTLTDGERHHPLWFKIAAHYKERLEILRAKNDGGLTPDETATIRGQIKEVKGILSLGQDLPVLD